MISIPLILIDCRRELIIRAKELSGLLIEKLLGKMLGGQRHPDGTEKKDKKMLHHQFLRIRKRELLRNWVNSSLQVQSLIGLK